ncbi:hypothetical protein BaRGS_00004165 [Batillaria attramentaria]|uniref:Uncharacterized protein n=1 Tax=Batillaria attramentaria TaxID=370345 RepID=A0ABD0LYB1_9CAEN
MSADNGLVVLQVGAAVINLRITCPERHRHRQTSTGEFGKRGQRWRGSVDTVGVTEWTGSVCSGLGSQFLWQLMSEQTSLPLACLLRLII